MLRALLFAAEISALVYVVGLGGPSRAVSSPVSPAACWSFPSRFQIPVYRGSGFICCVAQEATGAPSAYLGHLRVQSQGPGLGSRCPAPCVPGCLPLRASAAPLTALPDSPGRWGMSVRVRDCRVHLSIRLALQDHNHLIPPRHPGQLLHRRGAVTWRSCLCRTW